jgi:SAM-dependent methyltransferase
VDTRGTREISHGKFLAAENAEHVWGWETPAGKIRATRRATLILDGADIFEGKRVLEIGCGTGNFTEKFAESGADIIAVDISPDLLKIAKSKNLLSEKVTFLEKRFEDCDVDGPFDAVIGSSILHHLDLIPALDKMFSLLKPSGSISFAEPNFLNPQIFLERKFRRFFPSVSPDETAFISWQLRNDLKRCGFERVRIEPFDWLHPATPKFLIKFVSNLGHVAERIPGIKNCAGSLYINAYRM